MQNTHMYIEIINYANKRYNAGIQHSCLVVNKVDEGVDEVAFVGLSKKQFNVLNKSIDTFMRKNAYKQTNDTHTYSDVFETAIDIKSAEQELQEYAITKQ